MAKTRSACSKRLHVDPTSAICSEAILLISIWSTAGITHAALSFWRRKLKKGGANSPVHCQIHWDGLSTKWAGYESAIVQLKVATKMAPG